MPPPVDHGYPVESQGRYRLFQPSEVFSRRYLPLVIEAAIGRSGPRAGRPADQIPIVVAKNVLDVMIAQQVNTFVKTVVVPGHVAEADDAIDAPL